MIRSDGRRSAWQPPSIRRQKEVFVLTVYEVAMVVIAFAALVVSIIKAARG
ncbi:MAG: hypothetical protein H7267_05115 [Sandarakinorhabdus sp.]|nr:hypothetical protein [Sandarakinorhabdus sp.]